MPGGAVQAWAAAAKARASTKPAQADKVYGWHVTKCCEKKGHSVWYVMWAEKVHEVHHTEKSATDQVAEYVLVAKPPPGLYEKPGPPRQAARQYGDTRGPYPGAPLTDP